MRKWYQLLKLLHSHGAIDKMHGLNIPKEWKTRKQDKRSYKWLLFSSKEMDKIADYLIKKWYLNPTAYHSYDVLWSKLIITEKWSDYVTDYLNKPRYTQLEKWITNHKLIISILLFIIIICVYLISWCKITDGFSAIDCTKTLIQK